MLSRALSSMLSCALPSMRALEAWPPPPPPPCKRDGPAGVRREARGEKGGGRRCLLHLPAAPVARRVAGTSSREGGSPWRRSLRAPRPTPLRLPPRASMLPQRHCLTNLDSANGRGVEGGKGEAKGALGGGGCQLSAVHIGDASPQPSCTLTHHTRLSYGIARPVALRGLKLGPLLGRQVPCRCMQAGSAQAAALAGLCARGVGPFSSLQRALPDLMSTPPA